MHNMEKFFELSKIAEKKIALSNNFIHDIGHTVRVRDMSVEISLDEKVDEYSQQILYVAASWHDVGQDDLLEADNNHSVISAELFEENAKRLCLDCETISIIKSIILEHRRSQKQCFTSDLARILWDADKLDSLSVTRIRKICDLYNMGMETNRYNYSTSFFYWENYVKNELLLKLNRSYSKSIYLGRFDSFCDTLRELKNERK